MISRSIPDVILGASVRSVEDSGLLEGLTRMATVSAVNGDGTVDVDRGSSHFPRVRCLSGYPSPAVGDTVEILRTAGGWVCVGALVTWDTRWQTPELNPGWTSYGSGYQTPRFRRVGQYVELGGLVSCGGLSGHQYILTLPNGYRPDAHQALAITASEKATTQANVYTTGGFRAMSLPANYTGYVSLNCRFPLY